jgi:hypothetical protein
LALWRQGGKVGVDRIGRKGWNSWTGRKEWATQDREERNGIAEKGRKRMAS